MIGNSKREDNVNSMRLEKLTEIRHDHATTETNTAAILSENSETSDEVLAGDALISA